MKIKFIIIISAYFFLHPIFSSAQRSLKILTVDNKIVPITIKLIKEGPKVTNRVIKQDTGGMFKIQRADFDKYSLSFVKVSFSNNDDYKLYVSKLYSSTTLVLSFDKLYLLRDLFSEKKTQYLLKEKISLINATK